EAQRQLADEDRRREGGLDQAHERRARDAGAGRTNGCRRRREDSRADPLLADGEPEGRLPALRRRGEEGLRRQRGAGERPDAVLGAASRRRFYAPLLGALALFALLRAAARTHLRRGACHVLSDAGGRVVALARHLAALGAYALEEIALAFGCRVPDARPEFAQRL